MGAPCICKCKLRFGVTAQMRGAACPTQVSQHLHLWGIYSLTNSFQSKLKQSCTLMSFWHMKQKPKNQRLFLAYTRKSAEFQTHWICTTAVLEPLSGLLLLQWWLGGMSSALCRQTGMKSAVSYKEIVRENFLPVVLALKCLPYFWRCIN